MQVKIFTRGKAAEGPILWLQDTINEWLNEKANKSPRVKIIQILQSECMNWRTITIFYE
jgi:hypothetical protein